MLSACKHVRAAPTTGHRPKIQPKIMGSNCLDRNRVGHGMGPRDTTLLPAVFSAMMEGLCGVLVSFLIAQIKYPIYKIKGGKFI